MSWQENLIGDDMPPRWMWHLDEELGDWFDDVKARHDSEHGGRDGDEEVEMWDNELMRDRGR